MFPGLWWTLPLGLWYQEAVLAVSAGSGSVLFLPGCLLGAAAAGLFAASLLSFLPGRASGVGGAVFLALSAVFFAVEATVQEVFTVYMTPGNLISGAGNVMEHYAAEALRSVGGGAFRFLVYLIPAGLLLFYVFRTGHGLLPEHVSAGDSESCKSFENLAYFDSTRSIRQWLPVCCAAGILLSSGLSPVITAGGFERLFRNQFSFDTGTETFGLVTALSREVWRAAVPGEAEGAEAFSGSFSDAGQAEQDAFYSWTEDGYPDGADGTEGTDGGTLAGADNAGGNVLAGADSAGGDILMGADTADDGRAAAGTAAAGTGTAARHYPHNVLPLDFTVADQSSNRTVASLSSFIRSRMPTEQNAYTGLFQGKNLILICAEAFCGTFLRPDLTPTLWRLTRNGFYFSQYIQQEWGGSTTTGEVAFLLGLSSNDGDETMKKTQGHNNYLTMGNQLQRQGYSSIAFHNGYYTYYSRHLTHENLGYNQFISSGNGLSKLTGHNYPTDTEMFVSTLPLYQDHEPFSVYYMTVSGHAPYDKNSPLVKKYYDRVNEAVGEEYAEKTKYYICYQMELENGLTELLKGLEEEGIADRTVIALTGDHYPYGLGKSRAWGNDKNYIADLIQDTTAFYWNQDQSSLVLWCGSLEGEQKDMACEISEPVCSLDILPTLSNLFRIPYDSRLLPGRDVFAPDSEPFVFWNNLSWVTDRGRYDSRTRTFFPAEGSSDKASGPQGITDRTPDEIKNAVDTESLQEVGGETEAEYIERMHRKTADLLLYCRTVLRNDYFGLLFGSDDVAFAGDELFEY